MRSLQHVLIVAAAVAAAGVAAPAAAPEPAARPAAAQGLTMGLPALAVSANGRFVAFESRESLMPEDINRATDIYVLDRATNAISLESAPRVAGDAPGDSSAPQLSADGHFIVFTSGADLTHVGGHERFPRVFLRDREQGTLRCLSAGANGESSNGSSSEAAISADGNVIVFTSQATNLVPGPDPNGATSDVYVWRRDTEALSRVVLAELRDNEAPYLAAYQPSLSADGEKVALTVTFDRPESRDPLMEKRGVPRRKVTRIFVKDLHSGQVERIGCPSSTRAACERGRDFRPALSGDGRFVVFASTAPDRVKDDDNELSDVFLFDRQTHALQLVSHTPSGKTGNEASSSPSISGDGRLVAFESRASNLVCERRCPESAADRNLVSDVFLFDRDSGIVSRISEGDEGTWWDASAGPAIDAAGEVVAFSSAHAMGPQDWRGDFDLFLWVRQSLTWSTPQTPVAVRRSYNAPADAARADLLRPFCRTCDPARTP